MSARRLWPQQPELVPVLPSESISESRRIQVLLGGRASSCRVRFYPQLGSTQDVARALARQGAEHGTLVVAGAQSAGYGRHRRRWWHDAQHGLAVSLIVRPDLPAAAAPGLVFAAALALRQAVLAAGVEAQIKWPNDLVVGQGQGRRKLAGILCQASLRAAALDHALIGVGLNVNTAPESFAGDAADASSLFAESGKKCNKYDILSYFCANLAAQLSALQRQGLGAILDAIRPCSATLGQRIQLPIDGQIEQVQALDFAGDGALIVQLDSGETRTIFEPPQ